MSKRHHLLAAGAIGALVIWFFAPALSGAASFAFRDAAHYYHPLFAWLRGQWGIGRMPLWNPLENIGVPLVAENTPSVFYPGKLVFALPLDYTLAYNLYIVAHVALAAVTSFRLARHWKSSVLAAALAVMSYAFCGNVLFQHCNVVFLVGAAWLPWAIQFADRMLREHSPRSAIGLGTMLAMMITGGDPQMAYNTMLLAAFYALVLWRAERREPAARSTIAGNPWRRRPVLLASAVVVCALLAAVQILPTLEASPSTGRGTYDAPRSIYELASSLANPRDLNERLPWYAGLVGGVSRGHQRQIYHFSVPPWRAIELLWPNVGGRPFPTNRRWLAALGAEGNLWAPSMYMGLLPLVLAAATWSLRKMAAVEIRFSSWMVVLGSLASLGVYGVAWVVGLAFGGSELLDIGGEVGGLYWFMTVLLPGYVYFRYPAKLFVVAALGLSLLAARGWDDAWQSPALRLRRWFAVLAIASAVGLCALALGWSHVERRVATSEPGPLVGPFDAAGAWWDIAGALVQTAALSVIFLVMLRHRGHAVSRWLPIAALLLTGADLATAQNGLILYAPAEYWQTEPGLLKALPEGFADYRVFRQLGPLAPSWKRSFSRDRYTECLRWDRETLWPKYELPYDISLVEASATMISSDYETLLEVAREFSVRRGLGPLPDASVLDLLGARVAIVSESASAGVSPLARPGEGMVALTRSTACPRAWIVHEVEQLSELAGRAPWQLKQRTREAIFPEGERRDWRQIAVVESDAPLSPPVEAAQQGANEHCKLLRAEPLCVELDVQLASAGLVVLSDLDYPGWELTVETDGRSRHVPIVRANRVMRGAALPAGRHRLVYRYRPRSVFHGAAISGASVLGLLAIALVGRFWKMHSK